MAAVLAKQGTYNTDRYAAPYDINPAFDAAIPKLYRGEYTTEQALDAIVKDCQDIIIKWLSS